MRKIAIVGLLLALMACSSPEYTVDKDDTFERDVKLDDGRTVHCLFWWDRTSTGLTGMSCDWVNIRSETD